MRNQLRLIPLFLEARFVSSCPTRIEAPLLSSNAHPKPFRSAFKKLAKRLCAEYAEVGGAFAGVTPPTEKQLEAAFAVADTSGDNRIQIEEFLAFWELVRTNHVLRIALIVAVPWCNSRRGLEFASCTCGRISHFFLHPFANPLSYSLLSRR